MADRAYRENDPSKGVFDLENDERWQERLAEARARRELVLKQKAEQGLRKPKPKPWEIDAERDRPNSFTPPPSEGGKGFDFADRVKSMRRKHDDTVNELLVPEKEPERPKKKIDFTPPPPEDQLSDVSVVVPTPAFREPGAASLVAPEAPDIAEIAARYASSLAPEHDDPQDRSYLRKPMEAASEVEADDALSDTVAEPQPIYRRGRPYGLIFAVMLLAIIPLFASAPASINRGPVPVSQVYFGVQPALGITSPMILEPEPVARVVLPKAMLTVPQKTAQVRPAYGPEFARSVSQSAAPTTDPVYVSTWIGIDSVSRIGLPVAPVVTDELSVYLPDSSAPQLSPKPLARPAEQASLQPVAPANPLRVTILVTDGASSEIAATIRDDIVSRGHAISQIMQMPLKISSRNLRYFHGDDRVAASELAQLYGAKLRDFTSFRPSPRLGVVELWLDGAL